MITLHELPSRIPCDSGFGRGEFAIGYCDRVRQQLVYVPPKGVHHEPDSHFCFKVTDN